MLFNDLLLEETNKPYYRNILAPALRQEYGTYECYPPKEQIFRAFNLVKDTDNVKVIILGQDPYFKPGQANGLAFSVNEGIAYPPTLNNILSEMHREFGYQPKTGDFTYLAEQGVLLLNTLLTVRRGTAKSHAKLGWEIFMDNILEVLGQQNHPMVVMLWGKDAKREKGHFTKNPNICILETTHPSSYSAALGFNSCDHFILCNKYLLDHGVQPINWFTKE